MSIEEVEDEYCKNDCDEMHRFQNQKIVARLDGFDIIPTVNQLKEKCR